MIFSYFSLLLFFFSLILVLAILKIKNTILSLFQFIFCIVVISMALFLFGLEFLPLCLIIIYVGVIAILFLFSLIMYNFNATEFSDFDFNVNFSVFFLPLTFFFEKLFIWCDLFLNSSESFFYQINLDYFLSLNYDITSFLYLYNIFPEYIIIFAYLLFVIFLGLKITKD